MDSSFFISSCFFSLLSFNLFYFTHLFVISTYCVFPSRSVFWTDCQKFFRNVLSFATQKSVTKIGLTSLDTVKKASVKNFFKLLFETRVARGILCPLQKIMMAEVIGHIQLPILRICGKKSVFAGMFLSPLSPQRLWIPNLARWWLTKRGSHPLSHMILWSRSILRSPDKLSSLYLHYHSAYEHQAWHGGDLPWEAPIVAVISCFDHVVLLHQLTKLMDYLVAWFCDITWQTKTIVSLLPQCLWPSNLAGWWFTWKCSFP